MFDLNSTNVALLILVGRILGETLFCTVLVLQSKANNTPKDKFTNTRNLITMLLSGVIILNAPGIAYQYIRSIGEDNEVLRALTGLGSVLSFIFTGFMFLMIQLQKNREK